jgi:hypothetical protein
MRFVWAIRDLFVELEGWTGWRGESVAAAIAAKVAPARLPEPATSPRPALCAHSCAKLAAIGACRQDVVQISLTDICWVGLLTKMLDDELVATRWSRFASQAFVRRS